MPINNFVKAPIWVLHKDYIGIVMKKLYLGFLKVLWLDSGGAKIIPILGSITIQPLLPLKNFAELKLWVQNDNTNDIVSYRTQIRAFTNLFMGLIDWMVVELNHYYPMDFCAMWCWKIFSFRILTLHRKTFKYLH